MICLTAVQHRRAYSRKSDDLSSELYDMKNKRTDADAPFISLKDESARQRWELFHRAIAHAKKSTDEAVAEADESAAEGQVRGPVLTVVR